MGLEKHEFEKGCVANDEAQLSKLLGSDYFNKGEYEKAVEFFGFFLNSSHAAEQSTQDSYQIGYSYFKTGDYKNAIILLEPLVNGKDVWTQYAMYTLGDSFLKTNNKQNADRKSVALGKSVTVRVDLVGSRIHKKKKKKK